MSNQAKTKVSRGKKVSVAYQLFQYQEQLRNPKAKPLQIYLVKYNIINKMVATTWRDLTSYSKEEREYMIESIVYRKKLKKQMEEAAALSKQKKKKKSSSKKSLKS